jgi:hypothetical protein
MAAQIQQLLLQRKTQFQRAVQTQQQLPEWPNGRCHPRVLKAIVESKHGIGGAANAVKDVLQQRVQVWVGPQLAWQHPAVDFEVAGGHVVDELGAQGLQGLRTLRGGTTQQVVAKQLQRKTTDFDALQAPPGDQEIKNGVRIVRENSVYCRS